MLLVGRNLLLCLNPGMFGMAALTHPSLIKPRRVLKAREGPTCSCLAVVLASLDSTPESESLSEIQWPALQTGLMSRLMNAEPNRTNISHIVGVCLKYLQNVIVGI